MQDCNPMRKQERQHLSNSRHCLVYVDQKLNVQPLQALRGVLATKHKSKLVKKHCFSVHRPLVVCVVETFKPHLANLGHKCCNKRSKDNMVD